MHTIVCQVLEQVKQVILWVLISSFYSPLLKSFGLGLFQQHHLLGLNKLPGMNLIKVNTSTYRLTEVIRSIPDD